MARQGLTAGVVLAGTYEITRLLGEGGMGAVWEARHLRLERKKVAIKVLHGFVARDSEAVGRFQREANIASRLGHPNIVQVHDFNTLDGGAPYLVLEYLEGESLSERLRKGAIPLAHALAIARQIASALQAAHSEGIVHRDLKPHNVFLCPSEAHGYATELVKVLDFGISKIQGSETVKTQTNAILGTPQYMSPEQAKGAHREVDQRTDVFALGAIVYEMLTGRAAFLGDSIPEVMFKVVYEEPPPLAELVPGLPANVLAAVQHALVKSRDQRCDSAATFIEALTGDPLVTLRGGAGTAAMNSPPLSPSLAAIAASKNSAASLERNRARSPEAFASTMATNPGEPADALGATLPPAGAAAAPRVAATALHAGVAVTAPPAASQPGTPAQPYMMAPALLGQLPAHAHGGVADTTPVVERPRHAPRRRTAIYAVAGSALLAALAAVIFVALPGRGGDAGVTGTSAAAAAGTTTGTTTGTPTSPGATQPASGTGDQPASGTGAAPGNTGQTAQGDTGQTAQTAASAGTPANTANTAAPAGDNDRNQARDPDKRPSRTEEDVPAELKQELEEAEAQVGGNPEAALARARKILGKHPQSSRAAAIMTRAYCLKRDLGNANGSFSRIRDAGLKRRVRRFCKDQGIDLQG